MRIITFIFGMFMASASLNAAEVGLKGGSQGLGVDISSNKSAKNLQAGAEWLHSKDNGDYVNATLGFGMGWDNFLAVPYLKAFSIMPSGKGKDAAGMAAGLRLTYLLPDAFPGLLYVDYSMAPDRSTYRMHNLNDFQTGLQYQVLPAVSVNLGYRHVQIDGKQGQADVRFFEGLFLGASWHF